MTIPFSSKDVLSMTKEQALRLSVEDRMAYFHAIRLRHPRVNQALADLKLNAHPGTGADITLLIGPTGVGKSTVVHAMRDQVLAENQQRMRENRALIPIIVTEAPASGERGFSWKIFYQRVGEELQEPLLSKKQETVTRDGRVMVRPVSTSATVLALRTSVEKALIHRSTSILVVDEAVHFLRNVQGNSLENHMDAVKSLANICGVHIILVGSYDLLPLTHLSAQVARRTTITHFPRYLTGEAADESAFAKVVNSLASYLPLEETVDLSGFAKTLQFGCVGCVGILKDTLSRALAFTFRDGGKWKDAHLERALLSPMQQKAILRETLVGEQKIIEMLSGSNSFRLVEEQSREVELLVVGAQ